MHQDDKPAIHTLLGANNILVIIPHAEKKKATEDISPLTILGHTLAENLYCYAVINSKYKPSITDMNDVRAIRKRKKITDNFLIRIKQFKEEISKNGLVPLILILQKENDDTSRQADIIFGYGQGERGRDDMPHRPTIAPSLLSKIRLSVEDRGFSTGLANTESNICGREQYSLNQLFRHKNSIDGFYDPTVRSLQLIIASSRLGDDREAVHTGVQLAEAFSDFAEPMPLVRMVAMSTIDTDKPEDLRFIFRIHGDNQHNDMMRKSYINELADSIAHNGLLHPLVLLQKMDGRYKILCGFRRFQALHRLNRQWVEAKAYNEGDFSTEDFFNISLAENTKRRNLNSVEIGHFLESANRDLDLNNARLAERFGDSLGIGLPGNKVSQSTIHKYRKLYQIRERGESDEMIFDVINDKLPFTIAAEILAPIKDPVDRDSLYLEIIKPLAPTRPQLLQITKLLSAIQPQPAKAIATVRTQKALKQAADCKQKAGAFLRILRQSKMDQSPKKNKAFAERVNFLRKKLFGSKASKQDFDISRTGKNRNKAVTLHIQLKKQSVDTTITNLKNLLNNQKLLDELRDLLK